MLNLRDTNQQPQPGILIAEPQVGAPTTNLVQRIMRYRITVLDTLAAALLLALIVVQFVPDKRAATATVALSPVNASPLSAGRLLDQVNMRSEENIASSQSVLEDAAQAMGDGMTAGKLRGMIDVTVPSQSLVLKITARSSSGAQAIEAANAVADAYLADRTDEALATSRRYTQSLQSDISSLSTRREDSDDADVRAQLDATIAQLRTQQGLARLVALNPGRIVSRAVRPTSSASAPWWTTFFGFTVLGIIVGALLALIRDQRDRVVRWGSRMGDVVAAPVLSTGFNDVDAKARAALGIIAARGRGNSGGPQATAALLSLAPDAVTAELVSAMRRMAQQDGVSLEVTPASVGMIAELASHARQADEADETAGRVALRIVDASGFDQLAQANLAAASDTSIVVAASNTSRTVARELFGNLTRLGVQPECVLFWGPKDPPFRRRQEALVPHEGPSGTGAAQPAGRPESGTDTDEQPKE